MKRAIIILIVLACASVTNAFVGKIEASFEQELDNGLKGWCDVVLYSNGDRWRREVTWRGPLTAGDNQRLASEWVESCDGGVFEAYFEEFNVKMVFSDSKHVASQPWLAWLCDHAKEDPRIAMEKEGVYLTKLSYDPPEPTAFAIRMPPGVRVEYHHDDVMRVEVDGQEVKRNDGSNPAQNAQLDLPARTNLEDHWYACTDNFQWPHVEECNCDPNGCFCGGWFYYYYERWVCAAKTYPVECYNTPWLVYYACVMCDHTSNPGEPPGCVLVIKGPWYYVFGPACW